MLFKKMVGKFWLVCAVFVCCGGTILNAIEQPVSADLSQAWNQKTETRQKISLNGIWRFAPVDEKTKEGALPDQWGFTEVPGIWTKGSFPNGKCPFEVWDKEMKLLTRWNDTEIVKYPKAWYERSFNVPPEWKGCKVALKFDGVNEYGRVYLNDDYIGLAKNMMPTEIDITEKVLRDKPNILDVFVFTSGGNTLGKDAYGRDRNCGLDDNVWLVSYPKPAYIDYTQIITSTRNHTLELRLRINNLTNQKQKVFLSGTVSPKEAPARAEKTIPERVFSLNPGINQVTVITPWENPKLWDWENPFLYQLVLKMSDQSGSMLDITFPETFGFREVWLDGPDFYLNNKKAHYYFAANPHAGSFWGTTLEEWLTDSYTSHKTSFNCFGMREAMPTIQCRDSVYEIADRSPYLCIPHAPGVYWQPNGIPNFAETWDKKTTQEEYEGYIKVYTERFGNHPSIIMWMQNFNWLMYGWQHLYREVGTNYVYRGLADDLRKAQEAQKILQRYDPTRPVIFHASGNSGDIHSDCSMFGYGLSFQEQEDWPELWYRDKKNRKPVFYIEANLAVWCYFYEKKLPPDNTSPSLFVEVPAMYLGNQSYQQATENITNWNQGPAGILHLETMKNLIHSWRGYDVAGIGIHANLLPAGKNRPMPIKYDDLTAPGIKPNMCEVGFEATASDSFARMFKEAFAPILVYIGGGEDNGFTSKDHAYYSGETIKKQIVAVNNHREDREIKVQVSFRDRKDPNKRLDNAEKTLLVPAGEVQKIPISFTAPNVDTQKELEILLTGSSKDEVFSDSFLVQVFPKEKFSQNQGKMALYDPLGKTREVFSRMGINYTPTEKMKDLKDCNLLVIGNNSLKPEAWKEFQRLHLSQAIEQGLNVLLFEQNDLSLLGLKTDRRRLRNVFPSTVNHPVFSGLKPPDFSNWRDYTDMISPYPDPDPSTEGSQPTEIWPGSTRGTVSTFVIKKPEVGNYRSLIDCGFDLDYSSLMEYFDGQGRIILSQLDLTCRYGKDPVATKFIHNLLNYACIKNQSPMAEACYLGNDKSETLLKELKVGYVKGTTLPAPGSRPVILGENVAEPKENLKKFVEEGGVLVYLPTDSMSSIFLPVSLKMKEKRFKTLIPEENGTDLVGITSSLLYWKKKYEVNAFQMPEKMEEVKKIENFGVIASVEYGEKGGRIIFCQVPPELFNPKELGEARAYLKTFRLWSNLLTNAGVKLGRKFGDVFTNPMPVDIDLSGKCKFRIDPEAKSAPSDSEKGMQENWKDLSYNDAQWSPMNLPGAWEDFFEADAATKGTLHLENRFFNDKWEYPIPPLPKDFKRTKEYDIANQYDGIAWYRIHVYIPASYQGNKMRFRAGQIDDYDITYFNGKEIGRMDEKTPVAYALPRNYPIASDSIIFGGDNVIAIRVTDTWQKGGIMRGPVKVEVVGGETPDYLDITFENPYFYNLY